MGNDMGDVKLLQIFYGNCNKNSGPWKVIKNLALGLDQLDYPYLINSQIQEDSFKVCLSEHPILYTKFLSETFVGPNLVTLPIDNSIVMSMNYKKYIINSQWTYDCYKTWIPEDKLVIWPVGIDTEMFDDKKKCEKTNDCLLYYKRRDNSELLMVIDLLKNNNQSYQIIEYGQYSEEQFLETISKSHYCILLDGIESQGIACEEILSCNLPMFVLELTHWNDRGEQYKFPASCVPYWDERCGIKSKDIDTDVFRDFLKKINQFNPREYILENLTLKKQASELISIVNA